MTILCVGIGWYLLRTLKFSWNTNSKHRAETLNDNLKKLCKKRMLLVCIDEDFRRMDTEVNKLCSQFY
ncbi:PREDICTED: uncharacterized protein LOC108762385 [Trachymyrmex cornetzi]|uniref:uncharacterized protein LOC108762385 n=1 Tax=Trachymyrmex cornetzi TaxID=471704 RepID=UPI00084F595A|nr:PREDICTED: uncharacterized protein LOC108762385 [Trachymyrmex cornetzi]